MFNNKIIKNYRSLKQGLFVLSLALVLQGCVGTDMSDLETFVATAHQDKTPEIEPLPEIPPFKPFEYTNEGESDPFSALNIGGDDDRGRTGAGARPDSNRRREPLEKYPLDALKLVGTITKAGVPNVVVKANTPEGKTIALLASIGNYMGQNDGKIKEISPEEQRVVLVETVLDPNGRWVKRDVEITIDE